MVMVCIGGDDGIVVAKIVTATVRVVMAVGGSGHLHHTAYT